MTEIPRASGYQLCDGDQPASQRSPLAAAPFTTLAVPAEAAPDRLRPGRAAVDHYFAGVARTWVDRYTTRPSFAERLRVVADLVAPVLTAKPAATVLDFGGGPGVFSALCSGLASRVVTLDRSPEMVLAGARGWDTVAATVDRLAPVNRDRVSRVAGTLDALSSAAEGRFDLVLAIAVLEYLDDPGDTVARLGRLLAADGTLIVTVPRESSLLRRAERLVASTVEAVGARSGNDRLAERGYTRLRPHGDHVPWYPAGGDVDLRVEQVRPLPLGGSWPRSLVGPNEVVVLRRVATEGRVVTEQ